MPKKQPAAKETVTAAYEAAGYATIPRDPEEIERGRKLGPATNPHLVYGIVRKSLSKESQEVFLVIPLDLRGQCLSRPVEVARGQRDHVAVSHSDIFRPVIFHNAKGFVVVHVHPSGHAKPSAADRRLHASIQKRAKGSLDEDVHYLDHVIVSASAREGQYFSFEESRGKKPIIHKARH